MGQIRKGKSLIKTYVASAIITICTLLHLSPPAWATDQKAAMDALNKKINLLIEELAEDRSFDENLARQLVDLDSTVRDYTGDTKMLKVSLAPQNQGTSRDSRMLKVSLAPVDAPADSVQK